ncbi:MAG: type transport system permease protein [Acidobacteriota bacterium]|jgi:ABC-2 type transport system permease protein|nr:type transport system permease protein [Acidobacteriota bacterium]
MSKLIFLLRRIRAYVIRDFQLEISYRFAFFLRILSVLAVVTTFFFASQIFTGGDCPCAKSPFSQWRDPLAAWITGLAVLNYFMTGFSSLANAIRSEQTQGTLEGTLMTPISITTLVVASSAWDFVQATFYSSLYFFFGWAIFGVRFQGSFPLAFAILLLTTLVLASVGILSASFAMVFKRGDPFAIFLGTGSALFSGVFFPTQLLGSGFNHVSRALPPTYGLDGIRSVLIEGRGFSEVREPIFTLLMFLIVLLPFSVWVFSRAVRRAKREGSLIQY